MKDTFYFSHDYNARNDEKIKKMMRKHKCLGYGIYWCLIEDLYNNANTLELDYNGIAFDYHSTPDVIKSIIHDFGLFVFDDKTFGSTSVERRIRERDEKSNKASKSAHKRWSKVAAKDDTGSCTFYILNIYNEEESFLKCGTTNESITRRYSGKLKNYSYSILYSTTIDLSVALNIQEIIGDKFEKAIPKSKFGGYLDCYSINDKDEILNIVAQYEKNTKSKSVAIANNEEENKIRNNGFNDFYENRKSALSNYGSDVCDKLKKYNITTPIVYAGKKIPVIHYDLVEFIVDSISQEEWQINLISRFGHIRFNDALTDFIKKIKTDYDYMVYESSSDFKKHFSNWLQKNTNKYKK